VASLAITPCEQRDKFQTKNELSLFWPWVRIWHQKLKFQCNQCKTKAKNYEKSFQTASSTLVWKLWGEHNAPICYYSTQLYNIVSKNQVTTSLQTIFGKTDWKKQQRLWWHGGTSWLSQKLSWGSHFALFPCSLKKQLKYLLSIPPCHLFRTHQQLVNGWELYWLCHKTTTLTKHTKGRKKVS
jgi:hypothetical protein